MTINVVLGLSCISPHLELIEKLNLHYQLLQMFFTLHNVCRSFSLKRDKKTRFQRLHYCYMFQPPSSVKKKMGKNETSYFYSSTKECWIELWSKKFQQSKMLDAVTMMISQKPKESFWNILKFLFRNSTGSISSIGNLTRCCS